VFVNSRDGSMLLDQPTLTLWAFGADDLINRVSVHHLLMDDGQSTPLLWGGATLAGDQRHDQRSGSANVLR
jgi:hypothetical protein